MLVCLAVTIVPGNGADAADGFLKPYKEKLFRYRKPIESKDGGLFLRIPYEPLRDINKRDEVPVRKVKSFYVSSKPKRHQKDLVLNANGRKVTHFAVGQLKGKATMTVIFLHGRDGSRHLGFDDERFGGNFNRVKNLMFRNKGIYISADFADFKDAGKNDIKALVKHYRPLTKGPLVIACGSMGTHICWRLARDPAAAKMIDGLVVMGGFPNQEFLQMKKARNIPIVLAHGGIDYVYKWTTTYDFYKSLRAKSKNYPVRYVVFDGGKHGTPVRMIDWRDSLNWIAASQ